MKLIVNADDAGYSKSRDRGILEGVAHGCITDVSVLVNGESVQSFMETWKATGRSPPGLHVNLTEGFPLCDATAVPSLVGSDGLMVGKFGFRERLANNLIREEEMKLEVTAQLKRFVLMFGRLPSHFDGHQHVHVLPGVCEIISSVMQKSNVLRTRNTAARLDDVDWLDDQQLLFYQSVVRDGVSALEVFKERGITYPHDFIGLSTMGSNMSVERIRCHIDKLLSHSSDPKDVCEFMVHPGKRGVSGESGCGGGICDFSMSPDREHELFVLMSSDWRDFVERYDIDLISFSQLGVGF